MNNSWKPHLITPVKKESWSVIPLMPLTGFNTPCICEEPHAWNSNSCDLFKGVENLHSMDIEASNAWVKTQNLEGTKELFRRNGWQSFYDSKTNYALERTGREGENGKRPIQSFELRILNPETSSDDIRDLLKTFVQQHGPNFGHRVSILGRHYAVGLHQGLMNSEQNGIILDNDTVNELVNGNTDKMDGFLQRIRMNDLLVEQGGAQAYYDDYYDEEEEGMVAEASWKPHLIQPPAAHDIPTKPCRPCEGKGLVLCEAPSSYRRNNCEEYCPNTALDLERIIVDCPDCDGKGGLENNCGECGGGGSVFCDECNEDHQCEYCEGTGMGACSCSIYFNCDIVDEPGKLVMHRCLHCEGSGQEEDVVKTAASWKPHLIVPPASITAVQPFFIPVHEQNGLTICQDSSHHHWTPENQHIDCESPQHFDAKGRRYPNHLIIDNNGTTIRNYAYVTPNLAFTSFMEDKGSEYVSVFRQDRAGERQDRLGLIDWMKNNNVPYVGLFLGNKGEENNTRNSLYLIEQKPDGVMPPEIFKNLINSLPQEEMHESKSSALVLSNYSSHSGKHPDTINISPHSWHVFEEESANDPAGGVRINTGGGSFNPDCEGCFNHVYNKYLATKSGERTAASWKPHLITPSRYPRRESVILPDELTEFFKALPPCDAGAHGFTAQTWCLPTMKEKLERGTFYPDDEDISIDSRYNRRFHLQHDEGGIIHNKAFFELPQNQIYPHIQIGHVYDNRTHYNPWVDSFVFLRELMKHGNVADALQTAYSFKKEESDPLRGSMCGLDISLIHSDGTTENHKATRPHKTDSGIILSDPEDCFNHVGGLWQLKISDEHFEEMLKASGKQSQEMMET